jgi:hypothetical protein
MNLSIPSKPTKTATKVKKEKVYANSLYHFIVNPNMSKNVLIGLSREDKKEFLGMFEKSLLYFRDNISEFTQNEKLGSKCVKFHAGLEIGSVMKAIHIDGFLELNNYNKLDFTKIRTFFNFELQKYSKGIHLDVRYVWDNRAAVERYSQKEGIKFI